MLGLCLRLKYFGKLQQKQSYGKIHCLPMVKQNKTKPYSSFTEKLQYCHALKQGLVVCQMSCPGVREVPFDVPVKIHFLCSYSSHVLSAAMALKARRFSLLLSVLPLLVPCSMEAEEAAWVEWSWGTGGWMGRTGAEENSNIGGRVRMGWSGSRTGAKVKTIKEHSLPEPRIEPRIPEFQNSSNVQQIAVNPLVQGVSFPSSDWST